MENQHTTPDFENQSTEPVYPDELVLLANSLDKFSINEMVSYFVKLRSAYTEEELAIVKDAMRNRFRQDITERVVLTEQTEQYESSPDVKSKSSPAVKAIDELYKQYEKYKQNKQYEQYEQYKQSVYKAVYGGASDGGKNDTGQTITPEQLLDSLYRQVEK